MPQRRNVRGWPPGNPDSHPENAPAAQRASSKLTVARGNTKLIAAAMPEDRGPDSLEAHLRRMLADLGLWGFHPYTSRRSAPGWPDWTIIGPRKVIFRELKSEHGRVTPEQRHVGEMLQRAGQSWRVWRPSDLLSGQIGKELTEVAGLQESLFPAAGRST